MNLCCAGLLQGYSPLVLLIILLQATGGLVVAATIKYADNILKGFATAVSILVSGGVAWLVLGDLRPGPPFLAGTALVIAATGLYGGSDSGHQVKVTVPKSILPV